MTSVDELLTDPSWLAPVLRARSWSAATDRVEVVAERIGEGFGLSGRLYRLTLVGPGGSRSTIVAKIEDAARTRRAAAAHEHLGPHLGRSMSRALGSWIDADADLGVLLLEDLAPAEQVDDLLGAERATGEALVRIVARTHSVESPSGDDVERYTARPNDRDRWERRVEVAIGRSWADRPATEQDRIRSLLDDAIVAEAELARSEPSWVHVDPHLDNLMRLPDGSVVLIDWSNAIVGPVELDLATLLGTLSLRPRPVLDPEALVEIYADERRRAGRSTRPDEVRRMARRGLVAHLPGVVRWLGAPDDADDHPRKTVLRDDGVARVDRAIAWLDRGVAG